MYSTGDRLWYHEQDRFEYTLLGTNDTRLVALLPGQENESIQWKSIHVQLDEELRYEALSYT